MQKFTIIFDKYFPLIQSRLKNKKNKPWYDSNLKDIYLSN